MGDCERDPLLRSNCNVYPSAPPDFIDNMMNELKLLSNETRKNKSTENPSLVRLDQLGFDVKAQLCGMKKANCLTRKISIINSGVIILITLILLIYWRTSSKVDLSGIISDLKQQAWRSDALEKRVQGMGTDIDMQGNRLVNVEGRVQRLETEIDGITARPDLIEKRVRQLEINVDKQGKRVGEVESRMRDIGETVEKFDWGDFVWVIDNWAAKRDATRIFSGAFYSHKHGYRMQLSLLPAATSSDQKSPICVYWHLVRGPFDDILAWPFPYSVTLSVIDQHTGSNYASSTAGFDAHPNPAGWTRPTATASGGICFSISVSLSELSRNPALSQNDKIFIRCMVRPRPTPTAPTPAPSTPAMANHVCYELLVAFLAALSCLARCQL